MSYHGFLLVVALGVLLSIHDAQGGDVLGDFVSGKVTMDFESKVLSYGLPDADEPNFLPYGEVSFFDTLSVGSRFYFDMTDIGKRMGRGDRTWDCWEIDFPVNARHVFSPEKVSWLPTSVELGVGYRYEYHPERTDIDDTQFWLAEVALPDFWIVPMLSYERDVVRDNGTYLNLCLYKEIEVIEHVCLTPAVAQGWGDSKRVGSYLSNPDLTGPLDRSGLMDSRLQISLVWRPFECFEVAAFVAYSDFLFDRHIRDASRNYIRQCDGGESNTSWCFPVGASASVVF